jgi:exopolysaccharide biosynthesis polyprenyl glycosylphosphotransferase
MARRIRRDNLQSLWLHRLMDVGLNWLAVTLAYLVKEGFSIGIPTEPLTPAVVIHTFAVVALIWLAVASMMELYAYKRRLFNEIVALVTALAVTIAFLNTYVYFARPFEQFIYPRYGMVLYAVFGGALLTVSRAIKHAARRALHRRGIGVRRVAVVGAGSVAQRLAQAFREDEALGYQFLGFITDQPAAPARSDQLGNVDQIEDLIRRRRIEEVIVALPGYRHQQILDVAHRCQALDVRLRVVPDLFEVVMIRASLSEIDDIPLIGLRDPVITGYQSVVKRSFDICVALFCLVLASPLFVVIPILIWLDSRGPVFFKQVRVGENGRPFNMYKFRSMVPDAEKRLSELVRIEELSEPAFKIRDDPRVTHIGRWLRRTSLDELPQLFNVLKGEMSMVGPRPEELQVVKHYQLWHRKRLSIKPGITGPMQVSGRGELSLDERIRLELLYISRYCVLEDIKYLLKTIPAVCRARGAY